MADLLIKGMKMPECCGDCPMLKDGYKSDWCYVNEADIHDLNALPKDCPLVEIPTHGRLIDADAFIKKAQEVYCNNCDNWNGARCRTCQVEDVINDVDAAPTVIEASEDGEQDA